MEGGELACVASSWPWPSLGRPLGRREVLGPSLLQRAVALRETRGQQPHSTGRTVARELGPVGPGPMLGDSAGRFTPVQGVYTPCRVGPQWRLTQGRPLWVSGGRQAHASLPPGMRSQLILPGSGAQTLGPRTYLEQQPRVKGFPREPRASHLLTLPGKLAPCCAEGRPLCFEKLAGIGIDCRPLQNCLSLDVFAQ